MSSIVSIGLEGLDGVVGKRLRERERGKGRRDEGKWIEKKTELIK